MAKRSGWCQYSLWRSSRLERSNTSKAAINIRNIDMEMANVGHRTGGYLSGLIFLLIVLSSTIWVCWMVVSWMREPNRLPLSRLVITGERHYTTNSDIRQAILAFGAPTTFMDQEINIIQQKIGCMPWIKQVSVRKQWPNELKIHVVEYVPVALWNDLYLLDGNGKVFTVPAERISNQSIPMLYGPEGSEQDVLTGYRTMNKALTAAKFQIKAVSMSNRHSWQLTLKGDIKLELGRNDRSKRLQRFIGIYPILLQQARNNNKRIGYVDLRYDSGLAVGWVMAYKVPK